MTQSLSLWFRLRFNKIKIARPCDLPPAKLFTRTVDMQRELSWNINQCVAVGCRLLPAHPSVNLVELVTPSENRSEVLLMERKNNRSTVICHLLDLMMHPDLF